MEGCFAALNRCLLYRHPRHRRHLFHRRHCHLLRLRRRHHHLGNRPRRQLHRSPPHRRLLHRSPHRRPRRRQCGGTCGYVCTRFFCTSLPQTRTRSISGRSDRSSFSAKAPRSAWRIPRWCRPGLVLSTTGLAEPASRSLESCALADARERPTPLLLGASRKPPIFAPRGLNSATIQSYNPPATIQRRQRRSRTPPALTVNIRAPTISFARTRGSSARATH